MRRRNKRNAVAISSAGEVCGPDVRALEMLLDYAMMEGAELRLPLFVLLLRAAQLELMTQAGPGGGLHGGRRKAKIDQCLGAVECRSFVAPVLECCIEPAGDALHGPNPSLSIGD